MCFMIASPGTLANMMIAAGDTDGNNNLTLDEIINAEGTEVLSDLIGNLIYYYVLCKYINIWGIQKLRSQIGGGV